VRRDTAAKNQVKVRGLWPEVDKLRRLLRGASHQTGWTGAIARATNIFATNTPQQVIELGKLAIAPAAREERTK
jgi:hypothetical protein